MLEGLVNQGLSKLQRLLDRLQVHCFPLFERTFERKRPLQNLGLIHMKLKQNLCDVMKQKTIYMGHHPEEFMMLDMLYKMEQYLSSQAQDSELMFDKTQRETIRGQFQRENNLAESLNATRGLNRGHSKPYAVFPTPRLFYAFMKLYGQLSTLQASYPPVKVPLVDISQQEQVTAPIEVVAIMDVITIDLDDPIKENLKNHSPKQGLVPRPSTTSVTRTSLYPFEHEKLQI